MQKSSDLLFAFPSFQLPLHSSVLFLQLIYVSLAWCLLCSLSVIDTIDHFGC